MEFLFYGHEVLQVEGDIGGYPIPQYRQKNWQIPSYRDNNRRDTDTVFMTGYAYPSGVFIVFFFFFFFISSTNALEINLSHGKKT